MAQMDPKNLLMQQQQAERDAALRSGKIGPKMLDDSDNNIGNGETLNPNALSAGLLYSTTPPAYRARLLNLTGSSRYGQSITVVFTAARVSNQQGFVGPVTGIIEFGNGSLATVIEIDIPVGPYTGDFAIVSPATQPQDSGAVIQVPTGTLRAFTRYDNTLITPTLQGYAWGALGSPNPLPAGAGPFAPAYNTSPLLRPIGSVQTKAFAAYFGRHYSRAYKTQYLFLGNGGGAAQIFTAAPIPPAIAPTAVYYCIPPFAKNVRLVRFPETSSMTIQVLGQEVLGSAAAIAVPFIEAHVVPAGPMINPIVLDGHSNIVGVSSTAVGDIVWAVKLIYEIGF